MIRDMEIGMLIEGEPKTGREDVFEALREVAEKRPNSFTARVM